MNAEPRVYVGTYAKYNNGSIAGAWISLDEHGDADSFHAAARTLHKSESDPELMFQDAENIPDALYGESHLDDRIWEWLALDEYERDIVTAWLDHVGGDDSIDYIIDCHIGNADSWQDYVYDWVDALGILDSMPENLRSYFDYEAFGRDLRGDLTVAETPKGVIVFS
jgi:antirestriction protein